MAADLTVAQVNGKRVTIIIIIITNGALLTANKCTNYTV